MENLSLTDKLALDRTRLANQRTFLAFIRTSIMSFASGITLLKLLPGGKFITAAGSILLILAGGFLFLGFYNYFKVYGHLRRNCGRQ